MSYNDKVQQEIAHYKEVENVHDLPEIFHYWSHNYLRPKLESLGFHGPNDHYIKYIEQIATHYPELNCDILSVGSGNGDTEVALAESLLARSIHNFTFTCLDINFHMLERAKQLASERQVSPKFDFIETDINNWSINKKYQIIIANQSLHHFLELETLFDKVYASLDNDGFFLSNDMIGRNGHMRWPEALRIVQALWSLLEDRHKWNHQLNRFEPAYENWDCSAEGFEGIRAQDILPLLQKQFKFHCFLGFSNLVNLFVDRGFGHNFDVQNPCDCYFIDFVAKLDDYYIELGEIKPTQMIASMTKSNVAPTKVYKHLTPEFCVRVADVIPERSSRRTAANPGANLRRRAKEWLSRSGFNKTLR
jgi:SAM-dependent methyltransferase